MIIGFGIFGGLAFLGLVYLYTQTKDRWNWGKIAKRSFFALGIILAIPIAGIIVSLGYGKISDYLDGRPKIITNYGGLTLGEKLTDVEFRSKLKDVSSETDLPDKRYEIVDTNLAFDSFNGSGKVDRIIIACQENRSDEVNGISCGNSSENIFDKYGKENIVVFCKVKKKPTDTHDIKQIRLYESEKYGITHGLFLNKVEVIFIEAPTKAKESEYWVFCDKQK